MQQCAVPYCGEDKEGAILLAVCTRGHAMHVACAKSLVEAARGALNDGVTTSHIKCPLCRDDGVFAAWKEVFEEKEAEEAEEAEERGGMYLTGEEIQRAMRSVANNMFDMD